MGKFRKKPVVIEAFKLGVDNMPDWFMDAVTANEVILHGSSSGHNHVSDTNADIHTLEGWHHGNFGDYIIRGVKGEIYPCKPDIFDMTYEADGKDTDVPTNCKDCLHRDACLAWIRHGKTLYDDFVFSVDGCSYFEDAVKPIENDMVNKWIPASGHPKDTCECWIAYKSGGDYFYSTGYYDGKHWRSTITHNKIPVIYWMPLPEPPKGE